MTLIMLCAPAFGQTTAEDWFAKGVALMNQSKYDEALQAFDKAIEINPQYVEAWAGKGWSLYGSRKYKEALQSYNKAIELNPYYADAWAGKGFVLVASGKINTNKIDLLAERSAPPVDEPLNAYAYATELDPNFGLAWIGMLIISTPSGQLWGVDTFIEDKRIAVFDKVKNLNPSFVARLFGLPPGYDLLSLDFQREVFLKEGYPRIAPSLNATPVPPLIPRKTTAERFAKLKNVTK